MIVELLNCLIVELPLRVIARNEAIQILQTNKSFVYFLCFFKSEELYQLFEKHLVDFQIIAAFHLGIIISYNLFLSSSLTDLELSLTFDLPNL